MKKIILLFVSSLWGVMTALAFDQYERMAVGETKTFYFPTEVTSRSGTMYNYNCTSDYINNVEVLSYTKTSVTVKALKYTAHTVHIRFDYWWSENGYNRTDTHMVNIDLSDGSGPDTDPDTDPYNYSTDNGSWGTISVKVGSTKTVYCNFDIPYSDKLKSIVWSSKYSYGFDIVSQNQSSCTIKGSFEMSGQKLWCLMKYGNSTYRAYYTVNVLPGDAVPDKISLPSSTSVKVGSSTTLSPTITPSNATTTLTWKSSNTSVATVSSSGVVKGVYPGKATITVTTSNGKSASCVVTVNPVIPTSISIPESKTIKVGETVSLSSTLSPSNATATITWYSTDQSIATVSSSGVVKGIGEGTARIIAEAEYKFGDGGWGEISSNTCYIYVKPVPTNVELSSSFEEVEVGNTITLTPTITPSNASYTLTWSSSNTNVATVSSSGVVRGVNKGTAKITVKTDNGLSATCDIMVTKKITIEDGSNYTNSTDQEYNVINYSRTFKNTNWQAWYAPFDLPLTREVLKYFSFAKFAGTYTEEDGSFYITVVRLKEGDYVQANTAYCVQAKVADSANPQVITLTDAILKAAKENSFYVLSAEKKITFQGNYSRKTVTEANDNWYALSGGQYSRQLSGNTIAPFRCFFTIEDREDNPYAVESYPATVKLMLIDEGQTAIENIENDELGVKNIPNAVYDLSGRRVDNGIISKGVYIIRGKKVFVK